MKRPVSYRTAATIVLTAGLLVPSSPAHAAPPENDWQYAPVPVPASAQPFHTTLDTTEATADPFDPDCGSDPGATVWYLVEGTGGVLAIDVGHSSYPAAIAVVEDGAATVCQEGYVQLATEAGRDYLVMIGSTQFDDAGGQLELSVGPAPEPPPPGDGDGGGGEEPPPPPPAPANDTRETAAPLGPLPARHEVDTRGATDDGTELQGYCGSAHSVWFSYRPAVDQHVALDTFGSDYDTQLSVLRVDPDDDRYLAQTACSDDALGTPQSRVELDLVGGTSYLVLVTTAYDGLGYAPGRLVLNAAEITPLTVAVSTAPEGLVRRDGLAFVDVTLTCSRPAQSGVRVHLRQRTGERHVVGDGSAHVGDCGTEPVTRRVLVFPDQVGGFRAGPVDALATGTAHSLEVSAEGSRASDVRLRNA